MRANIICKIADTVGCFVEKVVAICTGLLLLVVACNVFARYILKIGLTWAEEFSLILFVWVVFLGAYLALRKKSHLALTLIIKKLPQSLAKISRIVILVLVILLLLTIFIGGISFVKSAIVLGQRTPLLGISAGWGYASIPASAGLMLLEIVRVLLRKEHIITVEDDEI